MDTSTKILTRAPLKLLKMAMTAKPKNPDFLKNEFDKYRKKPLVLSNTVQNSTYVKRGRGNLAGKNDAVISRSFDGQLGLKIFTKGISPLKSTCEIRAD